MERRDFIISLSGTIAAIAGGCKKPEHKIIPSIMPEEVNQVSKSVYYHTVYPHYGIPYEIMVKTIDGRPIKIEANPDSIINPNGTNALIQASIFSLYNPERFFRPTVNKKEVSLDEGIEILQSKISSARTTDNIIILDKESSSPLLKKLKSEIANNEANVNFFDYPISTEQDIHFDFFQKAKVGKKKIIISLGADTLGSSRYSLLFSRLYTNPDIEFLSAEPYLSLTGISSKLRETRTINELEILAYIVYTLAGSNKESVNLPFPPIPDEYSYLYESKIINYIRAHPDKEIYLFCGDYLSTGAKIISNKVNRFEYKYPPLERRDFSTIKSLINQNTLLLDLDGVVHLDMFADLSEIIAKENRFALTENSVQNNEYYAVVLPRTNYLEEWEVHKYHGNSEYIFRQPVVSKLNKESISKGDLLLSLFHKGDGEYNDYYDYIRRNTPLNNDEWESALQIGHKKVNELSDASYSETNQNISDLYTPQSYTNSKDGLTLIAIPDVFSFTGLEAGNPYLEELPHPITKQSYGRAAVIGEKTAAEYNIKTGDIVKLRIFSGSIEVPIIIIPGTAYKYIIIESVDSIPFIKNSQHVRLTKTDRESELIISDSRKSIGLKKELSSYSEEEILGLKRKKESVKTNKQSFSKTFEYNDKKWEMRIDQSLCIGCNACVLSCQIENNIPVVGGDNAKDAGTMHWLRVNTFIYEHDNELVAGEFEPLMCQHCENAPCETVCPVGATSHSPHGLNEMTYNRCVGARFCMVNCPYDIRTFNYTDHFKDLKAPLELLLNPKVTVRSRGVAEKCTFCVQRLNECELNERISGEKTDVQTACQQVCPTNAIEFGIFLNTKNKENESSVQLLAHLNTIPAVSYKSKFRNNG